MASAALPVCYKAPEVWSGVVVVNAFRPSPEA